MSQIKSEICWFSRTLLTPRRKSRKRDRIKKITRKSVVKMLAVMEASQSTAGGSKSVTQVPVATPEEVAAHEKEFLSSGRTGRRNALPDILAPHVSFSKENQITEGNIPGENALNIETLIRPTNKRQNAIVSSEDLPNRMGELSVTETTDQTQQPGTSKS